MDPFASEREDMVRHQLEGRGIGDKKVLTAMRKVPRHKFVPEDQRWRAYGDGPLPIGQSQTISQPYVVALMCELLKLTDSESVLEIGTGSGYAAAVLSELCRHVTTIERLPGLAERADETLDATGFENVNVKCADGTLGCPEDAPFDAILVSAGAPETPEVLKQQLAIGGRLVIPVGRSKSLQELLRIRRVSETGFETEHLGGVAFVPLIGEKGWQTDS